MREDLAAPEVSQQLTQIRKGQLDVYYRICGSQKGEKGQFVLSEKVNFWSSSEE